MSAGGAFGGNRGARPVPPEKGVFPLDHLHECDLEKKEYVACLKSSGFQSEKCRAFSKKYLECRMERRSTEISLVIRQTMEASILTHLMPRSQIDIFVQVLQADGETRSACINAATLALADAGIPMRDIVTSCSAGYLCSTPLLDLNYAEDSAGGPDVTVGLLSKMDKVTLLQMDAKLPMDIFENVMQLAIEGCKAIANYFREVLLENTKQLESRRGG